MDCEYEVSLLETYRGEAALKMLEGAVLPEYDTDSEDIYLVKFKIAVTEQENDAIVALPMGNPTAFPSNSVSLFSNGYECISDISYANRLSLISKGEHVETWLAFIVSKDDERPCIMWNISNSDKVFRDTQDAVDDPDAVESGTAIETEPLTESDEASADDTVSGEDTPEDSQSEDSSSN